MQLGEAEPLRTEDDHDRRVRYVDADLDDGRGYQRVDLAIGEAPHDRVALFRGHAAVHEPESKTAKLLLAELLLGRDSARHVVAAVRGRIYPRGDDERLLSPLDREAHPLPHL